MKHYVVICIQGMGKCGQYLEDFHAKCWILPRCLKRKSSVTGKIEPKQNFWSGEILLSLSLFFAC